MPKRGTLSLISPKRRSLKPIVKARKRRRAKRNQGRVRLTQIPQAAAAEALADLEGTVTYREVASHLNCSPSTLVGWFKTGKLARTRPARMRMAIAVGRHC